MQLRPGIPQTTSHFQWHSKGMPGSPACSSTTCSGTPGFTDSNVPLLTFPTGRHWHSDPLHHEPSL